MTREAFGSSTRGGFVLGAREAREEESQLLPGDVDAFIYRTLPAPEFLLPFGLADEFSDGLSLRIVFKIRASSTEEWTTGWFARRQEFIDAIEGDQPFGWNFNIRPDFSVNGVQRLNSKEMEVSGSVAGYYIDTDELLTVVMPAASFESGNTPVCPTTFTIHEPAVTASLAFRETLFTVYSDAAKTIVADTWNIARTTGVSVPKTVQLTSFAMQGYSASAWANGKLYRAYDYAEHTNFVLAPRTQLYQHGAIYPSVPESASDAQNGHVPEIRWSYLSNFDAPDPAPPAIENFQAMRVYSEPNGYVGWFPDTSLWLAIALDPTDPLYDQPPSGDRFFYLVPDGETFP